MALVEGGGLAWERNLFFQILRAMVRHGKTKAGGGPQRVLVVEHHRLHDAARLCRVLSKRFSIHLCLCLHVDSLHPQFDDSSSGEGGATDMP